MLRIQLLFNTIAINVRIQLRSSSIGGRPPNIAYRLAIFEGSHTVRQSTFAVQEVSRALYR